MFLTSDAIHMELLKLSSALCAEELCKKVLTMADFYFAIGSDPRDVFIVIGDNWVHYKRCETEEIAKALVIGQNESRRDDNA